MLSMRRAKYQRVVHEHVIRSEMGAELGDERIGVDR
jgi:hypothetical protein